jgi:quinol monooxygenase YgiN
MYGTIARIHAKPDALEYLMDVGSHDAMRRVPGFISQYVYRSDADPNEYWLVVLFESKEAYEANAADPAQDASYQRMRAYLADDPEWHDGEIVTAVEAI